MVGRVQEVQRRLLAEPRADRLQEIPIGQFVASATKKKSIGTLTASRCSARLVSGLPG